MAMLYEVRRGPNAGVKFRATIANVRIGRGANCQIRLNDEKLPDGSIEIESRHGGYVITNNMSEPVYLDKRPLQPGESRTLYEGVTLQPTPGTLLRLSIVASPPGVDGVVIEEPPKPPRGWLRRYWAWAVLGGVLAAYAAGYGSSRPVDAGAAGELKTALARLEDQPTQPASVKAELRFARLALTDAVYHDAAGRGAEAARNYCAVRDALVRLARMRDLAPAGQADGEAPAILDAVERFVSDRLKAQPAQSLRGMMGGSERQKGEG